jgi:hypothetical protein
MSHRENWLGTVRNGSHANYPCGNFSDTSFPVSTVAFQDETDLSPLACGNFSGAHFDFLQLKLINAIPSLTKHALSTSEPWPKGVPRNYCIAMRKAQK